MSTSTTSVSGAERRANVGIQTRLFARLPQPSYITAISSEVRLLIGLCWANPFMQPDQGHKAKTIDSYAGTKFRSHGGSLEPRVHTLVQRPGEDMPFSRN